jgi:protein involved in polysaccharide export with SLBB domain
MLRVLIDYISYVAIPFLDDIRVKGPKTDYNNEEIRPRLRRFVVKHIVDLNKVLSDVKRAGITVAIKKL